MVYLSDISLVTYSQGEYETYCPSCGAELPPNSKFCSECGLEFEKGNAKPAEQPAPTIAPRRSPPSQSPPAKTTSSKPVRSTKPRQKAGKVFVSAILVLALVGAVFAAVTVMTWGSYKGNVTYSYDPAVPSTSDAWSFNVDTADLDVKYTTIVSAPEVQVYVQYDFAGGFLDGKTPDDLYSITWDNSSGAKAFSLNTMNWWGFPMFQNNLVTVTLKTGINYNITASTSTGFGQITVPDNENLTALSVSTSTGSSKVILGENVSVTGTVSVHASTGSSSFTIGDGSRVGGLLDVSASTGSASITTVNGELAGGLSLSSSTGTASLSLDGTILGGDISIDTSTGGASVSLANITISTDIDLNVSVSTGSIYINVDQTTNPGGNITASITTSTGSAHISYRGDDAHASAKFNTSTITGGAHFINEGGFTTISGSVFQSLNQSNPSRFDAQVSTSTGSTYITGLMV
jgi:hypothetical protein